MTIDEQRIFRPFLKIRSSLQDLPPHPTPEQVHKLRIQLRRVEAALDALGLDSRRVGRRTLRHARSFRRLSGKIHDMDVLTALAASLQARDCEQYRIELLEYIGARRYRQLDKLLRSVRKDGAELRKDLKRCQSRIQKRIGRKAPARARVMAAATMTARILELGVELARYPRLGRRNLHHFRVRAKHLRYILQMAGECGTPFFYALDAVKERVGDWHDWEELAEIARQLDGHPGRRTLLAEIGAISETKFLQAMEVSRQLRDQHLARLFPPNRPLRIPSRPALVAARPLAA